MCQLAGGISIVTVGRRPHRNGLLAASVTALGSDVPRLMVSFDRGGFAFAQGYPFGISVLAGHHAHLAVRFESSKGEDAFAGACWHSLSSGAPVLCDALAAMDCEIEEIIERHAHAVVICRVLASRCIGVGSALTHWRGNYHQVSPSDEDWAARRWEPIVGSRNIGCG